MHKRRSRVQIALHKRFMKLCEVWNTLHTFGIRMIPNTCQAFVLATGANATRMAACKRALACGWGAQQQPSGSGESA